jgi:hypothetical protein
LTEELPMLSTLFRLGLLAGFIAVARRILAPEASPPPRLTPPSPNKGIERTAATGSRSRT